MAEPNTEAVECPLCGRREGLPFLRVWDRFDPARVRRWSIVRCRGCDLLYLSPRPTADDLDRYYEAADYDPFSAVRPDRSLWDRAYQASRQFMIRWKRRVIERHAQPGRLLDVGCGTGEFLHFMQKSGWQTRGLEPDARAARFARETYGLAVDTAAVEALERMQRPWDVVTFWHVLEHLAEPVPVLRAAADLLASDGWMVVALPNPTSIDARVYGHRWVAWDAPRHLVHFSPSTLARAAEAAGLEVIEQRTMPLDAAYNCLMSERYDSEATPGLKWLRGLAVAALSWLRGAWPFGEPRGSSVLYLLRHKRRTGK